MLVCVCLCSADVIARSLACSLSQATEDMCSHKLDARLYERLRDECLMHVRSKLETLNPYVSPCRVAPHCSRYTRARTRSHENRSIFSIVLMPCIASTRANGSMIVSLLTSVPLSLVFDAQTIAFQHRVPTDPRCVLARSLRPDGAYPTMIATTPMSRVGCDLRGLTAVNVCTMQHFIRSIFLCLDRKYVIQTANVKSLWDMGLELFRQVIALNDAVSEKLLAGLLQSIEAERQGEIVDKALLRRLLKMLDALGVCAVPLARLQVLANPLAHSSILAPTPRIQVYTTHFEREFLDATTEFYAREGQAKIESLPVRFHHHHHYFRCYWCSFYRSLAYTVCTGTDSLVSPPCPHAIDRGAPTSRELPVPIDQEGADSTGRGPVAGRSLANHSRKGLRHDHGRESRRGSLAHVQAPEPRQRSAAAQTVLEPVPQGSHLSHRCHRIRFSVQPIAHASRSSSSSAPSASFIRVESRYGARDPRREGQ